MNTKEKAPTQIGAKATPQTGLIVYGQSTTNDASRQIPGYIAEAKRHIDTILLLSRWDRHECYIGDATQHHVYEFTDIFANALVDAERDVLIEYIDDRIGQLPHDFQRISACLLFFGTPGRAK